MPSSHAMAPPSEFGVGVPIPILRIGCCAIMNGLNSVRRDKSTVRREMLMPEWRCIDCQNHFSRAVLTMAINKGACIAKPQPQSVQGHIVHIGRPDRGARIHVEDSS